jgi:hypothetical protein
MSVGQMLTKIGQMAWQNWSTGKIGLILSVSCKRGVYLADFLFHFDHSILGNGGAPLIVVSESTR